MHIIAGALKGQRLVTPRGHRTRPTADQVRIALMDTLMPYLDGARFLDVYAGAGTVGLEALSRGAAHATFVERDKAAAASIAANLGRTHLAGARARIVRAEAIAWLGEPDAAAAGPFGIVVVDPPYAEVDLLGAALDALAPVLAPGARVVAKHFWRDPPPAQVGLLASERERRFGETTLTFYRRQEDR